MGIQVYFYNQFSKRKNSTLQPQENTGTLYTCVLKDNTSVTAPIIEIHLASSDPTSYTYAYIPLFNRYYFVKDWVWVKGVWTAPLVVDPMASFKTGIGALTKYVIRSSSQYDTGIIDTMYPVKNPWHSQQVQVPVPFDYSERSYVIGFICAPSPDAQGNFHPNSQGSVTYYMATEKQIVQIIRFMMSDDFVNILTDPSVGLTSSAIKNFMNPLDYIASVMLYPFEARNDGFLPSQKPKIGWWDMNQFNDFPSLIRLDNVIKQFTGNDYRVPVVTNPYAIGSKGFLKYAPYTRYHLQLEPFGSIPLDTTLVAGAEYLYTTYDIDLITGMCRLSVGTESYKSDLGVYNSMVGVTLPLSQITTDIVGGAIDLVGGLARTIATPNIGGQISSFLTGIGNAVDSLKPQQETKGTAGSIISYNGVHTHEMTMQYADCVTTDIQDFGAPLCALRVLNTLSGYIQCEDGRHNINAYDNEKLEISDYLTGGFFYE